MTEIKGSYAALVDNLHTLRLQTTSPDVARMLALAITEAQTSQMWAVKAVTWAH